MVGKAPTTNMKEWPSSFLGRTDLYQALNPSMTLLQNWPVTNEQSRSSSKDPGFANRQERPECLWEDSGPERMATGKPMCQFLFFWINIKPF